MNQTPDETAPLTPVLTRRWASPRSWDIGTYRPLDGYQAVRTALTVVCRVVIVATGAQGRHQAALPGDQR